MHAPQRSKTEIAELNMLANLIPPHSLLGNNHEAIHAQIKVIRDNMSRDAVLSEYEEGDSYVLSAALDAHAWLRGDGEPVSESWFELIPVHEVQTCAI